LDQFGAGRGEELLGQLTAANKTLDEGHGGADPTAVDEQASGGEDGVRKRGEAAGTHLDFGSAAGCMQLPEVLHVGGVEDFLKRLVAEVADGGAVEPVALAAGVDSAVVFDVHGTAPEVVAAAHAGRVGAAVLWLDEICFVLFDADLVNAGNGGPEAPEVVDFVGVAGHANHLDDDLKLALAVVLHLSEADEVVADSLEAGAFSIVFEGFFGGSIEGEGDVGEWGIEEAGGGFLVEEDSVGGEERGDAVLLAVLDAIEDLGVHQGLA
jgi:hypothetical protein